MKDYTARKIWITVGLFAAITLVNAAEYHVSPSGDDAAEGTSRSPFRTIQKAADIMIAGDTCFIKAGTYRETVTLKASGEKGRPIRFIGATSRDGLPEVTIDGTDEVKTQWRKVSVNGITAYSTPLGKATVQVFCNNKMMTEARWPDMTFSQIWDRNRWAKVSQGNKKNLLVSEELAKTGVDWTGAMATLNVGHQFKSWSRKIQSHSAGSSEATYSLQERLSEDKDEGRSWWDDRFYLSGKIEALTAPQEWFYDSAKQRLFLIPQANVSLDESVVSYKKRDYGFTGRKLDHIEIKNIKFFGCTFSFSDVRNVTIKNCNILFPNYENIISSTMPKKLSVKTKQTSISGNNNTLKKISIAYGNTAGIVMSGSNNRLEDSIIHDVSWNGVINYPGIWIRPIGGNECSSVVSRCTVYNTGNIGIWFLGKHNLVEYNHVYNSGLNCSDIAAIHTGSPNTYGSIARYNWVHNSTGKGMRGDDQTRGLTFHNNVIWGCDEGMIVKGDFNKCYNNTIIGKNGHGGLIIPTRAEPKKWWTKTKTLEVQNSNSMFYNNLAEIIAYRHDPLPDNPNITNNYVLAEGETFNYILASPSHELIGGEFEFKRTDFRPGRNSIVIDRGAVIKGIPGSYLKASPDIGAYEAGGESWRPGASWKDEGVGMRLPTSAEISHTKAVGAK